MDNVYFLRDTSAKARSGLQELANNVAKSLAKKAERSDIKKLIKERENDRPSFLESQMSRSMLQQSQMLQPTQEQVNRSMHEIDLMDPDNSQPAVAKQIRTMSLDVDIIKKDLLKISNLHMDNVREITSLRDDLVNEVKQVRRFVRNSWIVLILLIPLLPALF